jgi:hypothetical protein
MGLVWPVNRAASSRHLRQGSSQWPVGLLWSGHALLRWEIPPGLGGAGRRRGGVEGKGRAGLGCVAFGLLPLSDLSTRLHVMIVHPLHACSGLQRSCALLGC